MPCSQGLDSVPKANAAFTYVDGDGTVPRESATAQGLEATASAAVMANHRGLVASQVGGEGQAAAWQVKQRAQVHLSAPSQYLSASPGRKTRLLCLACCAPQEVWTQVLRWLRQPLPAVSTSGAAALMHPRQCTAERPVLHAAADGDLLTPLVPAAEGEDTRNPLVWWALLA